MTAIEVFKKSVQDQSAWLAALVLGMIAAGIDLHSGSRWPHILLLFCSGLLIAFCSPRWTWRWTITLGLSLPALVLLSGNWGPTLVINLMSSTDSYRPPWVLWLEWRLGAYQIGWTSIHDSHSIGVSVK